ncbi:MAG: Nif11-like leader peptide family natural product precursor [Holophagales bacterium]|nr:Nif11-like leader peptide family natural product precursor [Holophagales bacterium]
MPGSNDVHAFLNKVDEDSNLRSQVAGHIGDVKKIAESHGFQFSEDELRDGLRQRWGMNEAPNYHQDPDTCFFG